MQLVKNKFSQLCTYFACVIFLATIAVDSQAMRKHGKEQPEKRKEDRGERLDQLPDTDKKSEGNKEPKKEKGEKEGLSGIEKSNEGREQEKEVGDKKVAPLQFVPGGDFFNQLPQELWPYFLDVIAQQGDIKSLSCIRQLSRSWNECFLKDGELGGTYGNILKLAKDIYLLAQEVKELQEPVDLLRIEDIYKKFLSLLGFKVVSAPMSMDRVDIEDTHSVDPRVREFLRVHTHNFHAVLFCKMPCILEAYLQLPYQCTKNRVLFPCIITTGLLTEADYVSLLGHVQGCVNSETGGAGLQPIVALLARYVPASLLEKMETLTVKLREYIPDMDWNGVLWNSLVDNPCIPFGLIGDKVMEYLDQGPVEDETMYIGPYKFTLTRLAGIEEIVSNKEYFKKWINCVSTHADMLTAASICSTFVDNLNTIFADKRAEGFFVPEQMFSMIECIPVQRLSGWELRFVIASLSIHDQTLPEEILRKLYTQVVTWEETKGEYALDPKLRSTNWHAKDLLQSIFRHSNASEEMRQRMKKGFPELLKDRQNI